MTVVDGGVARVAILGFHDLDCSVLAAVSFEASAFVVSLACLFLNRFRVSIATTDATGMAGSAVAGGMIMREGMK